MKSLMIKNLAKISHKMAILTVIGALMSTLVPVAHAQVGGDVPLTISDVTISTTDETATITWRTNRKATGRIEYGVIPGSYTQRLATNLSAERQQMTIFGLSPDVRYYFTITAQDGTSQVTSFERNFKTDGDFDNKAPIISDVRVAYVSGKTVTIQWLTNEPADSFVEYGKDQTLGSRAGSGHRTTTHEVTINNLQIGASYHYRVTSKDEKGNLSIGITEKFKTLPTDTTDKDPAYIFAVQPTPENNVGVTQNSAVINWRTNRPSQGTVVYGTNPTQLHTRVETNTVSDFLNSVTLVDLQPGVTYYYKIETRDVVNKQAVSEGHSFVTKGIPVNPPASGGGVVLGVSSCSTIENGDSEFGFYGRYYNFSDSHPKIPFYNKATTNIYETVRAAWRFPATSLALERIDQNLNFGGGFLPVDTGLPGDPYHFAAHWQAVVTAKESGTYTYRIGANNIAWMFIDGKLIDVAQSDYTASAEGSFQLNAGNHLVEVFFADLQPDQSELSLRLDNRLIARPTVEGCETGGGVVLGDSTDNTPSYTPAPRQTPVYACNPNKGYTPIIALYKTTASPDIYAVFENGQKHYIAGPDSFNQYECDWSRIQTVSQQKLASIPDARLVRTPADPSVNYLFQRAQTKWIRIAIPSPTVFVSYKDNYWGNIVKITPQDMASYPKAHLAKSDTSANVYQLTDQGKKLIPSVAVFEKYGFDWAEVVTINQTHLDSYSNLPALN